MKKAFVIGYGRSGKAAEKLLGELGFQVFVYDRKFGNESVLEKIEKGDLVVVSPGVPPNSLPVKVAEERGAQITTEIEVGLRPLHGFRILITGTNGKTSLCMNLERALAKSFWVERVGNEATPPSVLSLLGEDPEILVIEASSFQLHYSGSIPAGIYVITSLSPDHIDWHGSYENYVSAKLKVVKWAQTFGTRVLMPKNVLEEIRRVMPGFEVGHVEVVGSYRELFEKVLSAVGVEGKFPFVSRKAEFVGCVRGRFVFANPKATNLEAVVSSLVDVGLPDVLLVGGLSKGQCWEPLRELAAHTRVVAFGAESEEIERAVGNVYAKFGSLREALKNMGGYTRDGDIVLFAPGGASFDEFESYRHRGRFFVREVLKGA